MEILTESKTEIKIIADTTSTNVQNNGLKTHKNSQNYPKQQIPSNKSKREKIKIKSGQSDRTVDKIIENLPMIKIQSRIKQIKNNLPPLFTESSKKILNEAYTFKTDLKSLSNIREENIKSINSIKRIYSSRFISEIGVNINKKSDQNIPTDRNSNAINSTPKSKTDDNLKINTKIKIILAKKETIIAKEKQFNNIKNNCLTLKDWKRRNRIDEDVKIFNCFSGYPDMRRALQQRGWQENLDNDSVFFNFKCALSTRNIEHDKLEKFQIINHYENSGEITRKGRLCHNLRNIKWFRDLNIDTFFPRCYDISDVNDFDDFMLDFQITKAESILKDYYYDLRNIEEKKLLTCINIFERKLLDTDHDDIDKSQSECVVISSIEWEVISEEEIIPLSETDEKKKVDTETKKTNSRSKSSSVRDVRKFNQNNTNINNILSASKPNGNNPVKTKKKKINYNDPITNDPKYKDQVGKILDILKEKNFQYDMNGSRNVWIMKPSGLSRGRGIKCIDSLSDIFQQVKHGLNQFVVQKYIENSLIILNRKFDIRQWVLVSSLNPLTVWLYEEPYVRFGAEDFDLNNIKNLYSHLTNNAIGCKSNKFEKSSIPGNMWNIGNFKNYLSETYERDVYLEVIRPKIKDIIIYSLESVQDVIKNRKNTHEIFGYDLMVDTNFDVWLIEINASPCMEYSTDITKQLVQHVMEDTLKVILDYPQNTDADTGLWTLIHKSKFIETPQVPVGFNLLCEGVKLKPSNEI